MQWVAGGPGNVPGRDLRPRFPDNQRQLQMAALSLSPARPTNQVQLAAQRAPGGEKPWWRDFGGEALLGKTLLWGDFGAETMVGGEDSGGEALWWRSTLVLWWSYLGGETMLEKKRCHGLNVPHISDQNYFCLDGRLIK